MNIILSIQRLGLIGLAITLLATVATAQQMKTCVVADPTGMPLNVRALPGGRVIASLANATRVRVLEEIHDAKKRRWLRVSSIDGNATGWVFADYLNCSTAGSEPASPASERALVLAVARENVSVGTTGYSRILVGSTTYLTKGVTIVKTQKSRDSGGFCAPYAIVYQVASDARMRELSEWESSMWRHDGCAWQAEANASAGSGEWSCAYVERLPQAVGQCLGIVECF